MIRQKIKPLKSNQFTVSVVMAFKFSMHESGKYNNNRKQFGGGQSGISATYCDIVTRPYSITQTLQGNNFSTEYSLTS